MIKPEQIPDAVVKEAWEYFDGSDMKEAIAAAINAWEIPWHRATKGQALDEVGSWYPVIMLPIPQEKNDA